MRLLITSILAAAAISGSQPAPLLIAPAKPGSPSAELVYAAQAAEDSISNTNTLETSFLHSVVTRPFCGLARNHVAHGPYIFAIKSWVSSYIVWRSNGTWKVRQQGDSLAVGDGIKCLKQSQPAQRLPGSFEGMAADPRSSQPNCMNFDREFWAEFAAKCPS